MMRLLAGVFLVCLCFGMLTVRAQTLKEFPSEPEAFYKSLNEFIVETSPDEAEAIMTELRVIWTQDKLELKEEEKMYKAANKIIKKRTEEDNVFHNYQYSAATPRLTAEQKGDIIRTANLMLKKRMKAIPDFKNYLYAVISFKISNQNDESFKAWQASLTKLLERANKYYAAYILGCNNLFSGNILYQSASTKWVASNNDYIFDFDSLPKVVFKGIQLTCYAKKDSSIIEDTRGVYYPTIQTWYGNSGKVNFLRAGFDVNSARAELSQYQIDVTGSDYVADSVVFFFPQYFKDALMGRFADKLLADVTPETSSYPRFTTYTKVHRIKNIVADVDYRGGFSLEGRKIIGTGNDKDRAVLTFYNKKKVFLVAASNSFVIRPDKITSDRTSITFYLDTAQCNPHCDSIYHPSLQFKYIIFDRVLGLIRTEEGVGSSPFYDSFHKLDIYVEGMYWKIDDPIIDMRVITGGSEGRAHFESSNYYKDYKFSKLQGIADVHPFFNIKRFTDYQHSRYIDVNDYAKFLKAPPEQVRAMLLSLSTKGFMIYESAENLFLATDRLYYYLNAKLGKIDYDVLDIESLTSADKSNARMSLLNYDLTLNGVSKVQVSDSQSVSIIPKDRQIVMKANRDFSFSGKMNSGRFEYFGKNFSFGYDEFKIDLAFIDSMRLKVPGKEKDAFGNDVLTPVKTVIQYLSGNLLIDNPNNKSGLKDFNEYPVFNSLRDSYVFYDRASIQRGVYQKDNFYFHLEPFSVDSLNSFDPSGMSLKGTFISAGIFPDFDEDLRLQPDFSLGFVRPTPPDGFPVYGNKGTYLKTIDMSHEGLRGDGELRYVTSVAHSKNIFFYPDSVNAILQDYEIKPQGKPIEFPHVLGKDVYLHWRPYRDRMFVYQKKEEIDFYDGQAFLKGALELSPKELIGKGRMAFTNAELTSEKFNYKQISFGADTSNFDLKSDESTTFAISTVNVSANIDFSTRTGVFKSNGGGSYVKFPANDYICYMDQYKWFMDDKLVELSVGGGKPTNTGSAADTTNNLDLEGSEFISTHPDQDSLRWNAPYAKYSLKDYVIRAEQVKKILVADAILYPDSGKVTVYKKARMETFTNSKILANSTTKYHNLYNVTANITSRKSYVGSGDYDYEDVYKKKQTLHFNNITVDTTAQTYAISSINDSVNFTLIPQIKYKGEVILNASRQFLAFHGFGKLNLQCEGVTQSWFGMQADINPAEVLIPLTAPLQDDKGAPIGAGLSVFNDTTSYVYSSLMAPRRATKDLALITPEGYLVYDKDKNEYKIASKEKLNNPSLPGNSFVFNDTKCNSVGEGKINFGADLGQVKLIAPGNVTNNAVNFKSDMDLMLLFNFFFSDDASKAMAEKLQDLASLNPSDNGRSVYEKGLAEIVGVERSAKMLTELNLTGSFKKMPEELLVPLFLTELHMTWNADTRSYRSSGLISIGNILKYQVNKQVQGQVEIVKKRTGDVLNVYLEGDAQTWYYFRYTKGIMEAVSSDTKFNDILRNLKSDKRQAKSEKETGNYEFMLGSERKKADFLKKSAVVEDDAKEEKKEEPQGDK